ncbi:hypothetical protein PYCC9005_000172 [Savitreella phatthalungensis]
MSSKSRGRNKKRGKGGKVDRDAINMMPLTSALSFLRAAEAPYPRATTLSLAVRLRLEKQSVPLRGTLSLPKPLPSKTRVAVFTGSVAERDAALAAGASVAGGEELVRQVLDEGKIDFDKCLATTAGMSGVVAKAPKLARVLGPKGLMPNAKRGTVVSDIAAALAAAATDVDYRQRAGPVVRMPVASTTFADEEVLGNVQYAVRKLQALGSAGTAGKGVGVTSIDQVVLSSTHGPGIPIPPSEWQVQKRI